MAFEPVPFVAERKRSQHIGAYAWAILAAYIIVYDIMAGILRVPTLSAAFHKASLVPKWRIVLVAFWFYLTAHLFRWLPPKVDAFRNLHKPITKKFH